MTTSASRVHQQLMKWSEAKSPQRQVRGVTKAGRAALGPTLDAIAEVIRAEESLRKIQASTDRDVGHYLSTTNQVLRILLGIQPSWNDPWTLPAQLDKDLRSLDDFLDGRWHEDDLTNVDDLKDALAGFLGLLEDVDLDHGVRAYVTALIREAQDALNDLDKVGPNYVRECAMKVNGAILTICDQFPEEKREEAVGLMDKLRRASGWVGIVVAEGTIQLGLQAASQGLLGS